MADAPRHAVIRLWPAPDPSPLDDQAILSAYAMSGAWAVRVNFVQSVDGAATVNGRSGPLGGPADKRIFDLLRDRCDAVMVGAGTLRAEGYGPMLLDDHHQELRRVAGLQSHPVLVVVSGALDLDPAHRMFVEAPVRPLVLTHSSSPERRRGALSAVADVLVCGASEIDFRDAMTRLGEVGLHHVLSEGGPHLFGSLVSARVMDELCLTVAPSLAGPGAGRIIAGPLSALQGADLVHVLKATDGELFLRYRRAGA